MKQKLIGKWRIESMELWDSEFIDLVEEGHFTFSENGMGSFVFGAVTAEIDWVRETGSGRTDFTWEGSDEGDPASGRGWAVIEDDQLKGRIYFHRGDASEFAASRIGSA